MQVSLRLHKVRIKADWKQAIPSCFEIYPSCPPLKQLGIIREQTVENPVFPHGFYAFIRCKTSFCSCGPKSLHMRARQPATGNRRACNCKTRFYHKYNGILQGPDKQKQQSKALFIFRLSPNRPWRISEFTRKNYSGITGLMQNNTPDDLNLPMEKGILTILE